MTLVDVTNAATAGIRRQKQNNCLCQNGGTCVLQNDLCVCQHGFTGRLCDIDMSIDKKLSAAYSCDALEHQYSEYKKCSKCICKYNLLTCVPHWNRECGQTMSKLKFKKIKNKSLNIIMKYSIVFSNSSYFEYIKDASAEVVYMNEFNFTKEINSNFDSKNNKKKLIVITSNLNNEVSIKGIYYVQHDANGSNKSLLANKLMYNFIFILLSIYIVL